MNVHSTPATLVNKPLGLLGGTFDPIHHGHLRLGIELYERLALQAVRFIPAGQPPHREPPIASAQVRLKMVETAIDGITGLQVDDRELRRSGPSYMVDTLNSLRTELPSTPLCLILGMDAFMGLHHWHKWQRLITLSHLIVVRRTGMLLPTTHIMRDFLNAHQIFSAEGLSQNLSGSILVEEIPILTISATQIRNLIINGKNPCYLLPSTVLNMIHSQGLYH